MNNRPTVLLSAGAVLLLAFVGACMALVMCWTERTRLVSQLHESDELFRKFQQETARLETEKAQLAQQHETLQSDAVSYMATNTKLQEEAENLKSQLADAQSQEQEKTAEIEKLQDKLEKLHKEMSRVKTDRRLTATKEFKALTDKVAEREQALKQERSLYQYNLGIVYAQAKQYDEAIESYRKSIEFNPNNADAHYNLGLLYERVKALPDRAVFHYRRYLELNPQAEDRDEVQQWIDMLTASVR